MRWAHLKEIPNTELLVSLNHIENGSSEMAIFDVSRKDEVKKIFSSGKIDNSKLFFSSIT